MTAGLVAAVAVAAVAVAVALWQHRAVRVATSSSRRRLAGAEQRAAQAHQEAQDAMRRVELAEKEARMERVQAQAAADRALQADARLAVTRRDGDQARASLDTLWALAALESDRAWRLTMGSLGGPGASGVPSTLEAALAAEVERIREETGAPGQFRAAISRPLSAADAVLGLRAVQTLLATLTRYSQSYGLEVGDRDGRLVATLACEGFDAPDSVADETTSLLAAIAPRGGDLDLDSLPDGRLQARLSLPLPFFSSLGPDSFVSGTA